MAGHVVVTVEKSGDGKDLKLKLKKSRVKKPAAPGAAGGAAPAAGVGEAAAATDAPGAVAEEAAVPMDEGPPQDEGLADTNAPAQ
jgi:hypothetical protein